MTDRDHFAAAALTGFIRGMPSHSMFHLGLLVQQSYEVADAMLRERDNHPEKPDSSTNHDAAPAARAEDVLKEPTVIATGEPGGVPEGKIRTGNTSAKTDTTQPRNGALGEPVAWANFYPDEEMVDFQRESVEQCSDEGEVVPLYRHQQPTLTDEEREAIAGAIDVLEQEDQWHAVGEARIKTLRNLLERLS